MSEAFVPFPLGSVERLPEEEMPYDPAPDVLEDVTVWVWVTGGYDGGEGEDSPENAELVMDVTYVYDDSSSRSVGSFIRALDGSGCGEHTEILALEKLKREIDETIEKLRRQKEKREAE